MKWFFSHEREAMNRLSRGQTLYAFDFDGTLAGLVSKPGEAGLSARTRELLARLLEHRKVAVITGRSVRDLRHRLGPSLGRRIRYIVGNHGLEGCVESRSFLARAARHARTWKRQLESAGLPVGVEIEDKRYSLALHYRRAPNRRKARLAALEAIAGLHPAPRVVGGKSVFNIVEPDAPHKGTALIKLMKKLRVRNAVYVGDDDTDEDVFTLPLRAVISVRVGKKAGSRAEFYLRRQSEINRLLEHLLGREGEPVGN